MLLSSDVDKTLPNRSNCDARLRRLSDSDWLSTTLGGSTSLSFPSVCRRQRDYRYTRHCIAPSRAHCT